MIITADLHAHDYKEFADHLPNGLTTRLNEFVSSMDYLHQCMLSWEEKVLVILGDVNHLRSYLKVPVHNLVYQQLKKIKESGIQIYLLVGNHDQYDQLGKEHSLKVYEPLATIIDTPQLHEIEGSQCYFIPHCKHKQTLYAEFEKITSMKALDQGILFLHQYIDGVTLDNNAHYYLSGLVVPEFIKSKFKWIISGDVHKKQIFDNIMYPGSLLSHNFGDKFQDKSFYRYDGKELLEYKNPHSPVFLTHVIEETTKLEEEFHFSETSRTYIEARCSKERYEEVEDYLNKFPNVRYRIVLLKKEKDYVPRSGIKLASTVPDNIIQYVNFAGEGDQKLIDLGVAIYEEAGKLI